MADDLTFSTPRVAPRHYITRGPSGHTETFERKKLDEQLKGFLAPAPVADMVDLFITARELSENKDPTTWQTVVGFLARTLNTTPRAIPPEVGIAFWGHVVVAMRSRGAN